MNTDHPIFTQLTAVGSWRTALEIVQAGIDPNLRDEYGTPLLVCATQAGSWEVFSALIDAGADPLARGADGINVFHHAIAGIVRRNWKYWSQRQIGNCKRITAYYLDKGLVGNSAQALLALAANKIALFRALLGNGLDPDTRVDDPSRVLLQSDAKKLLKAAVKDRNRAASGEGFPAPPTLLMWAAGLGRDPFVKLLISAGADQRARDDLGYTCKDYAEIFRRSNIAGQL